MENINNIEINIDSIGKMLNLNIFVNEKRILVNDKVRIITSEKINELLRIIRSWESISKNGYGTDEEKVKIKVISKNSVDLIEGILMNFNNYAAFKEWLGEFYA